MFLNIYIKKKKLKTQSQTVSPAVSLIQLGSVLNIPACLTR
jgi:hypothetical protein